MEFHEKLQKLRSDEGLTQEELAEKLFVSRTAISKWESGRGYPSIDSLKAIAKHFHVTIDELIGMEEIVTLAEEDKKESVKKHTALLCGVLDCLTVLLLFLPVYGNREVGTDASISLFALTGVSRWLRIVFVVVLGLTVLNGAFTVAFSGLDKPDWTRHRLVTGTALSILGTMIFILARQPYAGFFCLCILLVKGFLLLKSK